MISSTGIRVPLSTGRPLTRKGSISTKMHFDQSIFIANSYIAILREFSRSLVLDVDETCSKLVFHRQVRLQSRVFCDEHPQGVLACWSIRLIQAGEQHVSELLLRLHFLFQKWLSFRILHQAM